MISNKARWAKLAVNHLISNKHEWKNCFIKNNQKILLDLADFTLQELAEPEGNLKNAVSQAMAHTVHMAAKPIKSLELHLYNVSSF